MDLGKAGWLSSLLEEVVEAHAREPAPTPPGELASSVSRRARARVWLRHKLRVSGLRYGTPERGTPSAAAEHTPEEQLFLAVVRTLARTALDIASLTGAASGSRREQLLLLFAVLTEQLEEAQALDGLIAQRLAAPRKLCSRLEAALRRRAVSLAGDRAYGLLLHNGTLYADAQAFGHQSIDYFSRGRLELTAARRRLELAARRKALLVDILTALTCADRLPSYTARRTILRQVDDLGLPSHLASATKAAVKLSFERHRPLSDIVQGVRSQELRLFILEQTLLASLVDGNRSRGERAFIGQLVQALHVPEDTAHRLELEVAEFYAHNRSVVDVFTVSVAAGALGQDWVARMQETLELNVHRIIQEARETGELYTLLVKLARQQPLSAEERQRMRAQLIDLAKVIPALAIFAAPGGGLLLVALSKVLPFSLLPSSFQSPPALPQGSEPPPEPPARARQAG